jgi:hypothetical protein
MIREEVSKSDQSLRKDFSGFQDSLRSQANAHYQALATSVAENVKPMIGPLKREIQGLGSRLSETEYALAKGSVEDSMKGGLWSSALRHSITLLGLAQQQGWDWRISKAIQEMKQALEAIVKTRQSVPDAEDAMHLSEAIDRLPPGFSADAGNLRTLLKAVRSL